MKAILTFISLLAVSSGCPASNLPATGPPADNKVVVFLNASEAKQKILEDAGSSFFGSLTDLDIAIRMQSKELPAREEALRGFKRFVQNSVLDWLPAEISFLKKVLKDCHKLCVAVHPDLIPDTLYFIKTHGREEGHSDYTRDRILCLPQKRFADLGSPQSHEKAGRIILHELFHIYARYQPARREELYKAIGFTKVPPVHLGPYLSDRKLTNPDAPDGNYRIEVKDKNNRDMEVILVVYSKYAHFEEGKDFKSHIAFALFEIRQENGGYAVVNGAQPRAINPDEVTGFFEQAGRNTTYIVHPEEILADNVRLLALSKMDRKYISHLDAEGIALLEKIGKILNAEP